MFVMCVVRFGIVLVRVVHGICIVFCLAHMVSQFCVWLCMDL